MATNKPDKPEATCLGRCPICKAQTDEAYRPFCSKRCADIDLGRWLGGHYAIAGSDRDHDEESDRAVIAEATQEDDEN